MNRIDRLTAILIHLQTKRIVTAKEIAERFGISVRTVYRYTSRARFYSLLVYRYVGERPLPDILQELGYSRSHFFREQQKAITMLASVLREKLLQQPVAPPESGSLLNAEAERVLAQREAVDPAEVV